MGYYTEKLQYDENKDKRDFCSICGIILNSKNIKGKCTVCNKIICLNCGQIYKKRVRCTNCKELSSNEQEIIPLKIFRSEQEVKQSIRNLLILKDKMDKYHDKIKYK